MSQQYRLKIVVDDKIPFMKGVLEPYAEIKYMPGATISQEDLLDTDALLIRTRTKCDASLLEGTAVKFIASATIGKDHIDEAYCSEKGIVFTNAPGCNAGSVAQYIVSALVFIAEKENTCLKEKVLGIIGVGHVGSKVAEAAEAIGMKVLLNDPPRERSERATDFVGLDELLRHSDIVTLHVPLNKAGLDHTYHMVNASFVQQMKNHSWLINSSRGEVADTLVLNQHQKKLNYVLDVWEQEPDIDHELMQHSALATPHIAGYSVDGKANGTKVAVNSLARFFGLPLTAWSPDIPEPEQQAVSLEGDSRSIFFQAVKNSYDIRHDDAMLKADPEKFEHLRGDYPKRWEFHHYRVQTEDKYARALLNKLNFE